MFLGVLAFSATRMGDSSQGLVNVTFHLPFAVPFGVNEVKKNAKEECMPFLVLQKTSSSSNFIPSGILSQKTFLVIQALWGLY